MRRAAAARVGWGFIDQAISSLTNFALALSVAVGSTGRELGLFSLVFIGFTLALGATRALTSEPLAVRFSSGSQEQWREGAVAGAGAAIAIGFAVGLPAFLVGLHWGGDGGGMVAAMAVVLPGLLLQDACRLSFFARGAPRAAACNDGIWAVGAVAGLLLGSGSPAGLIAGWGAAGTVAALVGCVQIGARPRLRRGLSWIRNHFDLGHAFLGEFTSTTAASQLGLAAVGAAAGLGAVGSLKGGQLLLGPLNVMFMGAAVMAVPEAVRSTARGTLRRDCSWLSGILAAAALIWGAAVLAVPEGMGTSLLGDLWGPARATIAPLAVWLAASGLVAGPAVGLRALERAQDGLRLRVLLSGLCLVSIIVGASTAGAVGAAWGLAGGTLVGAAFWWRRLVAVTEGRSMPVGTPAEAHASIP